MFFVLYAACDSKIDFFFFWSFSRRQLIHNAFLTTFLHNDRSHNLNLNASDFKENSLKHGFDPLFLLNLNFGRIES